MNSYAARQPDTDLFRLWEVAGTSHADAHLLGIAAPRLDCGAPINNAPLHIVAKAAFHALDSWVTDGAPPPEAPLLDTAAGTTATIQRNADGIATGGIRTPPLDVPVDVLSGVPGPTPSTLCLLLGSTKPLTPDRIAALYPSRDAYQKQYDAAVDATIKAGFAMEGDRAALEAFAQPDRVS